MNLPRGACFHEKVADNWAAGYARGGFKKRLEFLKVILDRTVVSGQNWLDLGCGSGVLTAELVKRGASVVAFDGSPSMLAAAKRLLGSASDGNVTFKLGDAQNLSWSEAAAFDGVLCSSVVEYVDVPDELILQVGRVLKDDGVFIVTVPPTYSLVRSVQKVFRYALLRVGVDKYAYLDVSRFEIAPDLLARWLAKGGLRAVCVLPFDPVVPAKLLGVFRPALLVCEVVKEKLRPA